MTTGIEKVVDMLFKTRILICIASRPRPGSDFFTIVLTGRNYRKWHVPNTNPVRSIEANTGSESSARAVCRPKKPQPANKQRLIFGFAPASFATRSEEAVLISGIA